MVIDEKNRNFIQENQRTLATLIKKYDFIDDLDITETVIMMIETTNSQKISMKILKQRLRIYISNYIKKQITSGNIKSINNILNKIMLDEKDDILIRFVKELYVLKLELDVDNYLNIIKCNEKINKLLEEYVDNLKETNDNQKIISSNIKNQILLDMIEIYCSQNEIKTISDEELLCSDISRKTDDYIDDDTKLYLMEISKIEMLTKEEEEKYTVLSQKGDLNARKILTEANLRLVASVAKRYISSGVAFLDLIQEGNLGLMKAVDKFDPSRGNKFSTYATWWIRQSIIRAIGNTTRNIRIPIYVQEAKIKIENAEISLINELGRYPTKEEISTRTGISTKELQQIEYLTQDATSLFKAVDDKEEIELCDIVGDPNAQLTMEEVLNYNIKNELLSVLEILTQREKETLILRYGLDGNGFKTYKEVGNILGIKREGVHHHEVRAKEKLKNNPRIKQMRDYINYN